MEITKDKVQICSRGVWDETIPGIYFNEEGVSSYALLFDELVKAYPRGDKGAKEWEKIIKKIALHKGTRKYDCIIGVSGGTDSCYLLHIAKQAGLTPLAVNLDNGWSSDIALKNIKKITNALSIDLETYVVDYEEIKDLLKVYMKASLPWIDIPTDLAIKAILYKIANREGIKYILRGNDFRSEGSQPREWTYGDGKQLTYLHKKFGHVKLKTFPNYTLFNTLYYGFIKGIKSIYPFYFIDYKKSEAQNFLKEQYGWEYYGGHHHENIFTKFAISYWLTKKFNIYKCKITLSAQILSGDITKEEALHLLKKEIPETDYTDMCKYVLKKLDLTEEEFNDLMLQPNKTYVDYPSYYPLIQRYLKVVRLLLRYIIPYKPMALFQIDIRNKNK